MRNKIVILNKTRLRLTLDDITARTPRDYGSCLTTLRLVVTLLLMMFVGVCEMWGQVGTDYSGTWYIANYNDGNYNSAVKTNNFYLCPASNYYDGDGEGKKQKPFLTTHTPDDNVNKDTKPIFTEPIARWEIEFVETVDGVDYYYIKLVASDNNKYYIVHNEKLVSNNIARARVHLQTAIDATEDNNLFFITECTKGGKTYLNLCPKAGDYVNNQTTLRSSINPAKANMNYYYGRNQSSPGYFKRDGIDSEKIYCGGLIGYWTTDDKTGVWNLEDVKCKTPVITYSAETGKVTITCETDDVVIYYTTDGSTPTSSSTPYNDTPFDITAATTIKAIAVKTWLDNSDVATVKKVTNPTINLTIPVGGYTYDGTGKEPEVSSVEVSGEIVDVSEYEVSYSNNINAGTASAIVTITGIEGGGFIFVNCSTTFDINPKPISVTANNLTKGYGDADPELTVTANGLINGDAITYTISREAGEDQGTYPITLTGTALQGNYNVTSFTGGTFTITPKALNKDEAGAPADGITITVTKDTSTNPATYGVTVAHNKHGVLTPLSPYVDDETDYDYTWSGEESVSGYLVTVTAKKEAGVYTGNYSGFAKVAYADPMFYLDGATWSPSGSEYAAVYLALSDVVPSPVEGSSTIKAYIVKKVNPSIGTVTVSPIEYTVDETTTNYIPEGVPVLLLSNNVNTAGFTTSSTATSTSDITAAASSNNLLMIAPAGGVPVKDTEAYIFYRGEFVLTKEGTITKDKFFLYNPNYTAQPEPVGDSPSPAFHRSLRIVIEDNETGIDDVRCKKEDVGVDNWYTLDGRRLMRRPAQKGIYIENGKIVIIR